MNDILRADAYEAPPGAKSITINFDNVECVFEVEHGYLICFTSGSRCFVSKEQRQHLVKAMAVNGNKGETT